MSVNNQVAQQCSCAENEYGNGKPVFGLVKTSYSRSFADSSLTVSFSHGESCATLTDAFSRVWGNQNLVYSHAPEVCAANSPCVQAAWSGSCPCGKLARLGNHGEGISRREFYGTEPSDDHSGEWIVNRNAFSGENYFGADKKDPDDAGQSSSVEHADNCVCGSTRNIETTSSHNTDNNQKTEIDPASPWAINVSLRHVPYVTPDQSENLNDLLAKKGN